MYLVYLGESGNTGASIHDPNQPHYVCVGLMVHEDQWNGIKVAFSQVCRRYFGQGPGGVSVPQELHGGEILQGKGVFSSWPKAKRLELIDDLLRIPIERETPLIVSYVDKHEFESAGRAGPGSERTWGGPWEPVFSRFIFSLDMYMDDLNMAQMPPEEMQRGEPVRVSQRAAIIADGTKSADPQLMQKLLKTEMDLPTGAVLESIHFVRSEDSHCTQLANMCAYFLRRHLHQPSTPNPQYDALEESHIIEVVYRVQM